MEKKPSLKEFLQYKLDNMFSRGTGVMVLWLAVFSFLIVFLVAVVLVIFNISPSGEESLSFLEAFWQSLMRTLDPGTMGGDQGWAFRVMMLMVTLGGIFIISALISVISSGLQGRLDALSQGRSRVIEEGHTIILGWNEQVFTIVQELSIANENLKDGCIVIMGEEEKSVMDQQIRERVGNVGSIRIVCRTGSPLDASSLEILNLLKAKSIIVLAPAGDDTDSEVLKTVLAILRSTKASGKKLHIVAELRNNTNKPIAEVVGGDEVEWLLTEDIVARVVAQTCHQSGLSLIYTDLMDYSGDEIYFFNHPQLPGKKYGEVLNLFERNAVMGIWQYGKKSVLNPPMETIIGSQDKLFLIAEDDDKIFLTEDCKSLIDWDLIVKKEKSQEPGENVLVLGWNKHAVKMLKEQDNYMVTNSHILVIANKDLIKEDPSWGRLQLNNSEVKFQYGLTTDRQMLNNLNLQDYQHVILLSYSDNLSRQVADSKTLITLMHLRDISRKCDLCHFSIVSEILDIRNRNLAEENKVDDFIVSDKIISLLISQVSETKELNDVFTDIFDVEGSEIYLKPASNYVVTGRSVNFFTVVESARQQNETAIGYRLNHLADSPSQSYGIFLNPNKSDMVQFAEDDKVIVIAEK